jgi:PAS domain S-box-containing protein
MIRWKYIWPYLVVIGSIGIMVYINAMLIRKNNISNSHIAKTINDAGRQRFMSQQLVTSAILIGNSKPGQSFEDELVRWNSNHEHLMQQDSLYNLALVSNTEIKNKLAALDPIQKNLFDQLAAVAAETADSTTIPNIISMQAAYLPMMDDVVQQMETQTDKLVSDSNSREVRQIVISGLLLILEIIVIIIPYHRKLIVAYRKLKDQKAQITQQSEKIGVQNDLLAQKNVELDKMHVNEELTLNGINAGIWSWDIKTGEEEWSPKFFSLMGYEPGQITANFTTFMNVLVHHDDAKKVQSALDAHLKRDEPYRISVRLRLKNSKYRWFEASGQAERDEYGQPVRMAGAIVDVHEKVLYQQQLEAMNENKSKLFAVVAHDLRSPVASVRSLLDLTVDGRISRQEFNEHIAKAKENITFLSEALDNILQWAQGQMQGLTRNPEKVDMRKMLNTLTNLYYASAEQKEITIELNMTGNHYVYADTNQVFIAVRNILSNAIKFTTKGGKITIAVLSKGGIEEIRISDNGVGMPQEDIDAIMQQKDHVTHLGTEGEKGTGLGLSLAIDSIKENAGNISIQSIPDEGTRVSITLPRLFA